MVEFNIYAKSAKGREEVATRRYRLPQTRRVALILVDGTRPMTELFQQVERIGLSEEVYAELASEGYIVPIGQHVDLDLTSPPMTGDDGPWSALLDDLFDAPPNIDLDRRYIDARWFMVDSIGRSVHDGAAGFMSRIERSSTLADLEKLTSEFDNLIRKSIDPGSAAWTIARLRTLMMK